MIHYKFLSTALLLGTVMLWSSCSDIEEEQYSCGSMESIGKR